MDDDERLQCWTGLKLVMVEGFQNFSQIVIYKNF